MTGVQTCALPILHDRTQVETVFDYYLYRGGVGQAPAETQLRYKVDAYLFYPRQFGLDQHTYPKERFFGDVRPMIRFREPKLSIKQMLGLKPDAKSPLIFLREYISTLEQGTLIEPVQNAIDEVRLFACSFVSNYLRGIDRCRRRMFRLKALSAPEESEDFAKSFQRMIRQIGRAHV